MDYPTHIETISMFNFKWLLFKIFKMLNIGFILVNSADPDEMPPLAAFHLDRG